MHIKAIISAERKIISGPFTDEYSEGHFIDEYSLRHFLQMKFISVLVSFVISNSEIALLNNYFSCSAVEQWK